VAGTDENIFGRGNFFSGNTGTTPLSKVTFGAPNTTSITSLFGSTSGIGSGAVLGSTTTYPLSGFNLSEDILVMGNCSICKNSINSLKKTCGHFVCPICLHKEILYNFEGFLNTEKFDEEIHLKCIICDHGSILLNKTKIMKILPSELGMKSKLILKCGKCLAGHYNVVMFCKTCKLYLCILCISSHPSKHNFTNDLEINNLDNFCTTHFEEELKLECETCSLPICIICKEKNHQGHKVEYIKESYQNKKEKIIESLPFKQFDEMDSYLDKEKEKILDEIHSTSNNFISNIHSLITTLNNIIIEYKNKILEVEENFKKSTIICKKIYKKFYDDLNEIESSNLDYQNLNLLRKLPDLDKLLSFKMKGIEKLNFYEDTLKTVSEKFKEEIKNLSEIQIRNDYFFDKLNNKILSIENNRSLNFKIINSISLDSPALCVMETNEGLIVMSEKDGLNIWQNKNNSLTLLKSIKENNYFIWNMIQLESGEIVINPYIAGNMIIYDKNFEQKISEIPALGNIICLSSIEGSYFLAGCDDGIIEMYNNTKLINSIKGHTDTVTSLLYVPDKKYVISGSYDKVINVWKHPTLAHIKTISDSSNSILALVLLNKSKLASSSSKFIKIWSLDDFNCLKTINIDTNDIKDIKSLGNDYFVTTNYNKMFKIWKSDKEYDCVKTFEESSNINCLEVTKNYEIITCSNDKLNIWQI
jgi:WD40 repeat protein